MEPIIQLRNLSKSYGTFKAVDELNLEVYRGEIFGLLGPNGAGKTTSILMMLGLTEPNSGTAHVCGYDATKNPIAVKQKVGYMPDSVGFYNQMTALENLIYLGRLNNLDESTLKDQAEEVLNIVGLAGSMDKKAGIFSRGMKQRLGLADVLIKDPEVIILDEPTLGIDPAGVKEFLSLIKTLSQQQGLTVLLSSHHLHHVQQVCDRVGIFVGGKLLAQGDIASLSAHLFGKEGAVTTIKTAHLIEQPWPLETEMRQWGEVTDIGILGDTLEFTTQHDITPLIVRHLVEKGYSILQVSRKEYGLDEIYQKYFESSFNENLNHGKSSGIFKRAFFGQHKR
ncbi:MULTISPECIES: ABC transporter ATP-binding protein [unclassified Pedobacter]|uniref:ABC transporter ATP-binding protein n=1 Tax=unclassified Pedobacter TaxID=2628915 RepID=UPI001D5D36AF|nr:MULTISPECIES: ABC transporter ATP-binding protein [unclassified Pedobacter]CAH0189964.1 ABC transporter ATP-binding protein NatA [Pedobacter sp. Bi36]CAH0245856.1 ABC transporter ATP-binding protein NatA [Pedobacter sp. Bi126]